jgi:DNA modification methylase
MPPVGRDCVMPELIWEGKYDARGKRVAPVRVSLPFQTVETVNESAQDRQRSLFFTEAGETDWRNRLIWGDKKYVLPALLDKFAGAVDLIYIDPPFATGQDFSFPVQLNGNGFVKEPSMIEVKAYRDTWSAGLDSYLEWTYNMAVHLNDLLSETGSAYVHVDPGVSHYVKGILDEVFGRANFRSEVIWKRSTAHSDAKQGRRQYGDIHDVLLFYSKGDRWTWNAEHSAYEDGYVDTKYRYIEEETGRRYRLDNLTGPGGASKGNPSYEVMGVTRYWRYSWERMQALIAEGRIVQTKPGGVPQYKRYLDEMPGVPAQDVWTDLLPVNSMATERLGYPTQKPEKLLERIIRVSSNEGDLVLDCVCGSGTTPVVAEKLGRRWLAADLGRFAIHTTRKRLLSIPEVKPFVVQNLGRYERQLWQASEFGESATARTAAYRKFILELYRAQPVAGYNWLHGLKRGRMVHVGTVDSPITSGDVKQIVAEFRKAVGAGKDSPTTKGIDLLGWDFAFELNEIARQDAERAGIDLRLFRIPREVLEKRAVEQGDIRFFELAALSVGRKQSGKKVSLTLEDFVIPLDDVPADVQKGVKHWSQWIDYWAVDWDNRDDTFHNEWQAYRTRKSGDLALKVDHEYDEPGEYSVVVKVIDILGNDTTRVIPVKVTGRAR